MKEKRNERWGTKGEHYAKYSNRDMTPEQVVDSYEQEAKAAGYKITDSGGGGGGWGDYGGSQYGMTAQKSDSYLSVQAQGFSAGESNRNTNFEVCLGPDKAALDECD